MATYSGFKRISTDAIVGESLNTADFANSSVSAGKIAANAITTGKLADAAVAAAQLATDVNINKPSVTYRAVVDADIATGAVTNAKLAAGMAAAKLGYTPVNSLNGAMTGNLTIGSGTFSPASPNGLINGGIALSSSSRNAIRRQTTNTIELFPNSNSPFMRFNGNGHLTTGEASNLGNPRMVLIGTAGWTYGNSYGFGWREIGNAAGWTVPFGSRMTYGGAGRIQVPVAGHYHFSYSGYHYNDDNNTPNYHHMSIARTGNISHWTGRNPHGIWMHGTVANHAGGVSMNHTMYLNGGEWSSPWIYWAGGPSRIHCAHTTFAGYLVG